MKKFLALLLALVVVLSFSSTAFATGSVINTPVDDDGDKGAELPTIVTGDVKITPVDDIEDLPEEAQKEFKEANKVIKDAVPEGMVARYFFYAENETLPYELTIKMDDIKDIKDVVPKIFKDGKWVDMDVVMNDDGTFTITVTANGPMAVCTTKK